MRPAIGFDVPMTRCTEPVLEASLRSRRNPMTRLLIQPRQPPIVSGFNELRSKGSGPVECGN